MKLSNKICPEGMSIEDWQVALRREMAEDSYFEIKHLDNNRIWGDYSVRSGNSSYKVAFRGVRSERNYCSCLDFRTNGLGTCKHIESVSLYLQNRVPGYPWGSINFNADYSSIYVSYKGGCRIKMRVGNSFVNEYRQILEAYFNEDDVLTPDKFHLFPEIYQKAMQISKTFRVYDDAREFIRQGILHQEWLKELDNAYPEKAIPWDKKTLNRSISSIETALYDMTAVGYGLIVAEKSNKLMHTVVRLAEEIYQGEAENLNSFIIVDRIEDIDLWRNVINTYSEASLLPIRVVMADEFISYVESQNENITFVYVDNALQLKNWKNNLSVALKKYNVKHLFMHIDRFANLSPVQISSILQHINPFVIGPYYKFIHGYRELFPLVEEKELLPPEIRNICFLITKTLQECDVDQFADYNNTNYNLQIKSKDEIDEIDKLFSDFVKIIENDEKRHKLIAQIKNLINE